ncbi:conserved hypothetical protein [uncultured Dysgonomonas sp.]|uniref:Uncharacterized protein n=1 Tax=uncultured Dysgonomonas sp. TaxID=206096 RepID=A0A212J0J9_9BACT|nr:hypothetical protein [uncultured Dysgonomonas sp.]SBV92947.1 conserved hypothetical protein [uncultured Dysgonomonas sp.]
MLSSEIIIRRLALIKYLYKIGEQQSRQVETIAGFSILSFHDCIEMFLLLVAEHNNVKSDSLSFMGFWDKFPNLTLKESMRAVKDRRVSAKHKGQFPSKSDIDISRISITDFLEQNSKIQFGVEFKDVSLLDLVVYDEVRKYLEQAQKSVDNKRFEESLLNSKVAFEELLYFYESNKKDDWYKNVLDIGETVNNKYEYLVGRNRNETEWFENITKTTNRIREILKITALGIDFKRYSLFQFLTPEIYKDMNGDYHALRLPSEKGRKIDERSSQLCIDFVLDCSIKLQKFDFDISQYLQ